MTELDIETDDGRTVHEFDAKAGGESETITGWVGQRESDAREDAIGTALRFETEGGESGAVRNLQDDAVEFSGKITLCGFSGIEGVPATEGWIEAMRTDQEAAREACRAAEREKELAFEVRSHDRSFDGQQTTTLVLALTKTQLTDDDRELVETLREEFGTVGGGASESGQIVVPEDVAAEIGEEFAAKELRELLDGDDVDDEHDEDPVTAALDEAAETGERVRIDTTTTDCDGSVAECSTDRVTRHATPSGDIETERTHTH